MIYSSTSHIVLHTHRTVILNLLKLCLNPIVHPHPYPI